MGTPIRKPTPCLPNAKLLALAVAAQADPRTCRKFLLGRRIHPAIQSNIERAMRTLGLTVPIPALPTGGR